MTWCLAEETKLPADSEGRLSSRYCADRADACGSDGREMVGGLGPGTTIGGRHAGQGRGCSTFIFLGSREVWLGS